MSSLVRCQPHLGTYVEISVSGDVSEDELISASNSAFLKIKLVQSLMSFHDEESELTRINRYASREPVPISSETKFVLEQALRLSEKTDGLFDITVAPKLVASNALPDHNFELSPTGTWRDIIIEDNEVRFTRPVLLDLGGIAKGYAVDQANEQMGCCQTRKHQQLPTGAPPILSPPLHPYHYCPMLFGLGR